MGQFKSELGQWWRIAKNEETGPNKAQTSVQEVLRDRGLHIKHSKDGENTHGDHLLQHLELGQSEILAADTIGRDLKAVLKKGDPP